MLTLLAALTLALPQDEKFTPYHEEAGVKIAISKTETHPWVRGVGLVAAAPEKVAAVLKDLGRYKDIFKGMIETSKVLKTEGPLSRVHLVWPFPIFMKDRDAVVTYEMAEPAPKKTVITWKRTEEPGDPSDGLRIERVEGRTELEPAAEATRMSYTYFADLGGDFGESLREKAWKHEPVKYFEAVRAAIK
jgi:hypothetical protein